jgi:GntR family transcriptional regulator
MIETGIHSITTSINRSSPLPLYAQLIDVLTDAIDKGVWPPGSQIPAEYELCETFGVSRTVIRQALNDMAHRGLVTRTKGKGTYVAKPKIGERFFHRLVGFYQDMHEQGLATITQVLRQETTTANPKVAAQLKVEIGTPVIDIERLRFVQNEPLQLARTYLPYHLCPRLASVDLTQQSLYAFLENEYGLVIAFGKRIIEAVAANIYEATQLRIAEGDPLLLLDSISFLPDGTPLECYRALQRGDRSRFVVEISRLKGDEETESEGINPHLNRQPGVL